MILSKERVKTLTSTSGTGTLTLNSTAEVGFQPFSVLGNATQVYYSLVDVDGINWEVGLGTYNSNTLTRDTIFSSSNSGSAISLSATGSTVFNTYPANKSAYSDVGVNRDYLADGNIDAGKPLILNTDNSVTQVAIVSGTQNFTFSKGSATALVPANTESPLTSCFDISAQRFILVYTNQDASNYLYGNIVEVDSSNVVTSRGIDTIISSSYGGQQQSIAYDSANEKSMLVYMRGAFSSDLGCRVLTATGTSLSVGAEVVINDNDSSGSQPKVVYEPTSGKLVVSYTDQSNSSYVTAQVGTISGTTSSWSSNTLISSAGTATQIGLGAGNGKVLFLTTDDSNNGDARAGTISGTTLTLGSPVEFDADNASNPYPSSDNIVCYDTQNDRFFAGYQGTGDTLYGMVFQISGTTVSHGTRSAILYKGQDFSVPHFSDIGKIPLIYGASHSASPANGLFYREATITASNNSIAYNTDVTLNTTNTDATTLAYDSTNVRLLSAYHLNSPIDNIEAYGIVPNGSRTGSTTNLSNDNYFGVASTNVVSGEQVGVNRSGSFNNNQSGMSAGVDQYATESGLIKPRTTTSLSTNVVLSNTTGAGLVNANSGEKSAFNFYCLAENTFVAGYIMPNSYPTIVAYTVATDGTVTYGTPIALKSTGTYTIDGIATSGSTLTFTYGDNSGSSTYGYIRGATLSGTTFTLGTEVEVSSASNYYNYMYCSLGYDSNANAGVVTYSYNSTSDIANASIKSKVFTLSGTTTTLGSEIDIGTTTGKFGNLTWGYYGAPFVLSTVFDSDNNKIIAIRSYPSNQGTESVDAYVGTVTGGATRSVSWGAKQTIKANTSGENGSTTKFVKMVNAIYDTINNRLLIANVDDNSSNDESNWKIDITNCTVNSNSTITINSSTEVTQFMNYPSFAYVNENSSYILSLSANEYYSNTTTDQFYKVIPSSTAVTVSSLLNSTFFSKYSGGIAYNSTNKTTGYLTYYFANSTTYDYDLMVRSGGFVESTVVNGSQFVGTARSGTDLELSEPPVELVGMANGAITKGKPVVIQADGDVAQVGTVASAISAGLGSIATELGYAVYNSTAFGKDGQRVTAYRGATIGSSNYNVTLRVATVSTADLKTITWSGESTIVQSIPAGLSGIGIIYDTVADKYILVWIGDSGYLYGCALTVSGSGATATVSGGTEVTVTSSNVSGFDENSLCYDTTNNFGIVSFKDSYPKTRSLSVSGTSLTAGTIATISNTTTNQNPKCAWNKYHERVVYIYTHPSTEALWYNVGTPNSNGTITVSYSTEIEFDGVINYNTNSTVISCDTDSGETVIIAQDGDDIKGQGGASVWGASGTLSGTTITFGSQTQLGDIIGMASNTNDGRQLAPIEAGKMIYITSTQTTSPTLPYRGVYSIITPSGTSISYGTVTAYSPQYTYGINQMSLGVDFDKTQALIVWQDTTDNDLNAITLLQSTQNGQTPNLTAGNLLGFAQDTVSDNQDVKVKIVSQTDANQTGLTTATQYFVNNTTGALQTTADTISVIGGTALSSTKILIKS